MTKQTVIVMTGDKLRHQYFASKILNAIDSSILLIEKQPKEPWGSHANDPSQMIQSHFNKFYDAEKKYFASCIEINFRLLKKRIFLEINDGEINNPTVIKKIVEKEPTLLIVLSTSLLKDHLIKSFEKRTIINLHAGLSPYYRGSGTNVFPFYNRELEYVGMTIHYLDVGIDSGDIILQGRPTFEPTDNTHTIGCKNIILGAEMMTKVINSYLENGPPIGYKQDLSMGRIYFKQDFNDDVLRVIHDNLKVGMVDEYIERQPQKIDIVETIGHAQS